MSTRLQVLLPESEMDEIRHFAEREKLPVGEWVRRALREVRMKQPVSDPHAKLSAVRKAAGHALPTADIGQMLAEIESGYQV